MMFVLPLLVSQLDVLNVSDVNVLTMIGRYGW